MGDKLAREEIEYYTTSKVKIVKKYCPFCGRNNTLILLVDGKLRVVCHTCHTIGPSSDIENPRDGDAVLAWNNREGV